MKAFAIAALLGLASTVAGQWTDSYNVFNSNGYDLTVDLEGDAVYGTFHYAEQATGPSYLKTEAYGVQAYAYGNVLATLTLDTWGIVTCSHTLYPFYAIPFEERFIYTRPEEVAMQGAGTFTHEAYYSLDVAMYETEVTEDYSTVTVSMYNDSQSSGNYLPDSSEWTLGDSVTDYVDPYYTGYLTDFVSSLTLPTYVNTGYQQIYTESYSF